MRDRPNPPLATLIPQHLRNREDEQGRALEALLGLLGEELGLVERDIDQLYDNWFIETCEPWVVPYIAALIGVPPAAAGAVTSRREVGHAIGDRRRRGALALLEALARDVAGWPARAVESYALLALAQPIDHV